MILHPSAQRVADELVARGARGPFRQFDVPTKSAADAAGALDCDVGAIASCLVFMVDDTPVIVIKSGAFRVDLSLLASAAMGESVRRATPDEVRTFTGQPIGGVSPVGWPGAISVFIDDSLRGFDQLWAACGTPNAVFATTYQELLELTGASPLSLGLDM